MKRKSLMAGNWKMHTTAIEARSLAADIARKCPETTDREVLLAPPFTVLREVAEVLSRTDVILASQNVCWEEKGAFTGEISPVMLKDCGVSSAIIGHSERRQIFHEDNALINKRVLGALSFDLMAILCIGETEEEQENGKTFAVLEAQVRQGLQGVEPQQMEKMVIAYEPVWAIGTGKTATKEQAQEVHLSIRRLIEKIYEKNIADRLRILYGGSVKPANVDELMSQPDIDGALVGGAALDAESFGRIINFI
ncbi:triose-phosphate isomerase [Desulfopila inferna]|uniref:triose-phosphate isomerase n=1 Tax=Desulfopila inferna TaxID=468528 RepID=UPI00196600CD|nr:triose-phosphate isomerase [Desulfopila inferna]MBM9606230.1 triose-phosphate isomerase [Desulfopila inferna]